MATSSEATGVLQMVEESSLHDIIKLNEQNLVRTVKKLEYFNRERDEILATDNLENVNEHYGLMKQLYKESQEIVRKVQQLKIEADLPTEDTDEWRDEQRSRLTKPGEDLQKIKQLMDESRVKEEKQPQMQESKEFEMRERIRQEQMEYEKKQRKLMAEEHKRQELEIMGNRRKLEEKLEEDRLKHIREAQMAPKPPGLQITKFTYTEQIAQLPTIHGVDVNKIHAFYAKLASCVHVLETMKLIGDIKGNLRMTLNKLPGIRENLTAKDENWTNWVFQNW